MMSTLNNSLLLIFVKLMTGFQNFKEELKSNIRNKELQFDAWFVVLLAVLLALAFTIYAGLMVWCLTVKGGSFTGNWHWSIKGVSVKAECRV